MGSWRGSIDLLGELLRELNSEQHATAGNVTALTFKVKAGKTIHILSLFVTFTLSEFAQVLLEHGHAGGLFNLIDEGIAAPTRLSGKTAAYSWRGNAEVKGEEDVYVRVTTNVDADDVTAIIFYKEEI